MTLFFLFNNCQELVSYATVGPIMWWVESPTATVFFLGGKSVNIWARNLTSFAAMFFFGEGIRSGRSPARPGAKIRRIALNCAMLKSWNSPTHFPLVYIIFRWQAAAYSSFFTPGVTWWCQILWFFRILGSMLWRKRNQREEQAKTLKNSQSWAFKLCQAFVLENLLLLFFFK